MVPIFTRWQVNWLIRKKESFVATVIAFPTPEPTAPVFTSRLLERKTNLFWLKMEAERVRAAEESKRNLKLAR